MDIHMNIPSFSILKKCANLRAKLVREGVRITTADEIVIGPVA